MNRRHLLAALLAPSALAAFAQPPAWPSRPLRLVVPFPAGGPSDAAARALAELLRPGLGQAIVVDNKAGAGGNIGTAEAMRAPKDGHTLVLISTTTTAINPTLYPTLPYDIEADLNPVSVFASCGYVLVARNGLATDLKSLLAAIRAQPGKLNAAYASTTSQVANAMFRKSLSLDFVDIPYKGDAEALTALMAGTVDFYFTVAPNLRTLVDAGKLRAIAVATSQRSLLVPNAPTFAQAGVPDFFSLDAWYGIAAPSGVPADVVRRLGAELQRAVARPEFIAQLATMGFTPVETTPAQAAEYVRSERQRWREPVRASGASPT